jgi:hypothetical protein
MMRQAVCLSPLDAMIACARVHLELREIRACVAPTVEPAAKTRRWLQMKRPPLRRPYCSLQSVDESAQSLGSGYSGELF